MPLKIIRQDITKINCDAIVNPSNRFLEPSGGADLAIHNAAGEELYAYCQKLGGCEVGKAVITPAFNLPARFVIHTAGPNWFKAENPEEILISCYRESLKLAVKNDCESIAFPLIGAGAYGCPKADVLRVATKVISEFLFENELLVYLVVYDKNAFDVSKKVFADVSAYIDDNYVAEHSEMRVFFNEEYEEYTSSNRKGFRKRRIEAERDIAEKKMCAPMCSSAVGGGVTESLDDMIRNMDKGFADTLFFYIDKKGITDVDAYKRSNVGKKTFSKIKCNKNHKPSKVTVISFAIGLKLDLEETEHLLRTAGFSLSNNNLFDVIIQYFVTTGKYDDIFDVNEVLYKYDQVMLGV
ncbi:MAG: macro domain-containing protein [Clostridia bacterium]|nr:macro domain-containing protein [Clostridia bacterium]